MNIRRWIVYGALIVIAAILAWRWWPNDVRRVERQMNELFELVGKSGPESLPVSAARSLEAGSHLASNVVLKLGEPFPTSMRRSETVTLLQQARMRAEKIAVKNRGHEVAIQDNGSIWYDVTLEASVTYQGQQEDIIGSYRFVWAKGDDTWKIIQADALDVIQHPSGQAAW